MMDCFKSGSADVQQTLVFTERWFVGSSCWLWTV